MLLLSPRVVVFPDATARNKQTAVVKERVRVKCPPWRSRHYLRFKVSFLFCWQFRRIRRLVWSFLSHLQGRLDSSRASVFSTSSPTKSHPGPNRSFPTTELFLFFDRTSNPPCRLPLMLMLLLLQWVKAVLRIPQQPPRRTRQPHDGVRLITSNTGTPSLGKWTCHWVVLPN